jgi:hypothetical protein
MGVTAVMPARRKRLQAPLLVTLGLLLVVESIGGLTIFFMRLATGALPGETLHVAAGCALTLVYVVYQWQHWTRVAPWRNRLDYALGLIATLSLVATLATGIVLTVPWWEMRIVAGNDGAVTYANLTSAAHNITSMLVMTFLGAHIAAVLRRDRARSTPASRA